MSTSENPYQSPTSSGQAIGVKSGRREDLRKVAIYQKGIMICILLYLLAVVGQFLIPAPLRFVLALFAIPVLITGAVFVFLLAMKVYETALGVLLGILALIPCLGLIVLLVVNGTATNMLRANGHKVGLLGASLSEFS
ncbi:MAG TPA: hypothetical protein VGX76_24575 [Pirellulales bacterium]|nr:hypothetical protein [Pirellulales bacterium]